MSDTITVNVKNVRADAWQRAKDAAERNDETLGSWASRALDQLAAAEAGGPRLIPPDEPDSHVVKPETQAAGDVAAFLVFVGAFRQAKEAGAPPEALTELRRRMAVALGYERRRPANPPNGLLTDRRQDWRQNARLTAENGNNRTEP